MSKLIDTHLNHDLQNHKSYVSFVWSDDQAKRLGLEVPFGTALADVEPEAIEAIAALVEELGKAQIGLPDFT